MSKKCNCGHELIFFHNEKKGEIILSFNGDRHVYDDGVAKAVERERERIIKLLSELLSGDENGLAYCYECNNWQKLLPDAIALIKGEAE